MGEQQYRLLNVGEAVKAFDEVYTCDGWETCSAESKGTLIQKSFHPVRRKLESEWKLIAENPPKEGDYPCEVGGYGGKVGWIIGQNSAPSQYSTSWTHWRPLNPPPKPEEPDPVIKAWKEYAALHSVSQAGFEDFKAGFNAGRKQ